ncbi:unnamed protein product [Paramecium sonneborni]|uniref:Uncharacterized protein n=1 Tax=Paramecium sonneborni TaxID=65129 RepID=A0A8S1M7L8_9CILI|nr:unnamed protein product [Paramecium sonneborni]
MNKKITLFVLLACVVCIATLMFSFSAQDGELKMKKSHSFSSSKNHEWMDGYWSSDTDCQTKCRNAGGMSCGNYQQNCCVGARCREEKGMFTSSLICDQRIPVQGCTNPK